MKHEDIEIGKEYYVRVRVTVIGKNDIVTNTIAKNGKPFEPYVTRFLHEEAAAFIPCEELDNPSANIGYLSAKLADNGEHFQNGNNHSEQPVIKVKLADGATMPRRAHDSDVGYDLTVCNIDIKKCISCDQVVDLIIIDTGVAIEPPPGYHVEVVPNSRICKSAYGYIMPNSLGIIDPDYRGTIKIVLRPLEVTPFDEAEATFTHGKVCGQLIIRKTEHLPMVQVAELSTTERGTGGFGSTEKVGKA